MKTWKRPHRGHRLTAKFCPTCAEKRPVKNGRCVMCKQKIQVKPSKYHSLPTVCVQGKNHPSKLEASRCDTLHCLAEMGAIKDLEAHPQPLYHLDVNGVHIADYRPDFRYKDAETNQEIVEDTKGWVTDVYRIKARLMEAIHGIRVQEVRRSER